MNFTDRLEVVVKVDEPKLESKIPAMILKLQEVIEHLKEAQELLPAFPSGGGSNNDAGLVSYKIIREEF